MNAKGLGFKHTMGSLMVFFLAGGALACGHVPRNLEGWTVRIAQQEGIEPEFLLAMFWVESQFCTGAVSSAGAVGVAQLTPAAAREVGVNRHDVVQNMVGGARYLRKQLVRFGRWDLALAAYNAGPQRVIDAGYRVPDITETINHVKKVEAAYWFFKGVKRG